MKALLNLIIGCFFVGTLFSQSDIASVEYFFDVDPGIGNGIILDVDPDVELLDQNFSIPTTGLSQGTHRLYFRVINADGTTSMYTRRTFHISDVPFTNSADITEAEYFLDTDPGIGNGFAIDVTDVENLDESLIISTTGLLVGTYKLFLRVKNSNNVWSMHTNRVFRVSDVPFTNNADIVEAEYFFDNDPGIGNGINIDLADAESLDEILNIPTTGLSPGTYRLFVRVKNSSNVWSMYANKVFRVSLTPFFNDASIVAAEYFIDVDPGIGLANALNLTGDNVDEDFEVPTPIDLAQGEHYLHIRVQNANGTWSLYSRELFEVDGTLGILDESLRSLRIYPIPTRDILYFDIPNSLNVEQMRLVDITGKIILETNNVGSQFSLGDIPEGIYLIQLETNSGKISKRIIKN